MRHSGHCRHRVAGSKTDLRRRRSCFGCWTENCPVHVRPRELPGRWKALSPSPGRFRTSTKATIRLLVAEVPFTATLVTLFFGEIGRKTQIATIDPGRSFRAVLSGRTGQDVRHDADEHPDCSYRIIALQDAGSANLSHPPAGMLSAPQP